jgi:hypothetical protein
MITGMRWFAGRDCIGIVQIVQEHEKSEYRQTGNANFKYYIGLAEGVDERADSQYIADFGMPFDTKAGDVLFNVIPGTPV